MFEHKKVLFYWESCTLELFVLVRLVFACPGARYCAVRRLRWWGSRRSGYQAMVIVRSRTMVAQCGREEDGPCHWAVGIGSSGVSRGRVFTSRMGVV